MSNPDGDDSGGGTVLEFPRPLLPPSFDASEPPGDPFDLAPAPVPAPVAEDDDEAAIPTEWPAGPTLAPPLNLLVPGIPPAPDGDEGGLTLPAPADPDNPGTGDTVAMGMTLAAAVGVAAATGLWHGALGLKARAAHRRSLADKARASADKAAGSKTGRTGTTTSSKRSLLNSGGTATKRAGGRSASPSGKRAAGGKAPSGRSAAAKGPGRSGDGTKRSWKNRGKDAKEPSTRAERRAARRAAKAAGGSKAASGSKGATGGKGTTGSKGSGGKKAGSTSGKSGRGTKSTKNGSGRRGRGRSWGRTRLGRATRSLAHRAAAGARAGGRDWRTGVDGGAKILAGKAAAKLPHRKTAGDTTTTGKPVDLTKPDKTKPTADEPVDTTTTDPTAADNDGQAHVDEPTATTEDRTPTEAEPTGTTAAEDPTDEKGPDASEEAPRPDPEPDDPRVDDPGFWAREPYEEPTPGSWWGWMQPPPGTEQTWVWKGAERADQPPGTEIRPALPAGNSNTSAGPDRPEPQAPTAPQGGPVNATPTTTGTQYRDAELTIYDVIDADTYMAEEILDGVAEAQHTAEGCDRLYGRLEELYATVIELQVPGILANAVLWLMDRTGTVKARAQTIAEKLPAASEAISTAGSNAAARHQGLADAVKDAGHTRPAERDYHKA